MSKLYKQANVSKVRYFKGKTKNFEHLTLKAKGDIKEAIRSLLKDPRVEYAQPNFIYRTPEDMAQSPKSESQGENCFLQSIFPSIGCKTFTVAAAAAPATRPQINPAPPLSPPMADPDVSKLMGNG